MTRSEVIAEVEKRLGRKLTKSERETIDTTFEIRRGVVTTADIPQIVADFQAGVESGRTSPGFSLGQAVSGGTALGGAEATATAGGEPRSALEFLPEDFRGRIERAAGRIGISDAELEQIVAGAVSQASQYAGQTGPAGETIDAEFILEPQVADWEDSAPSPIGVPRDYVAIRETLLEPRGGLELRGGRVPAEARQTTTVDPRYFDGDEFSPAGLDPGSIAEIQQRLVDAGLLEPDEFWSGFWDVGTAEAYKSALGMANRSGVTVDQAIDQLASTLPESIKEARRQKEAAKVFQAPPFITPDPAKLAQGAKQYMRGKLNREPTDAEMRLLTEALSSVYRADYEAEVAAMRAEFEAETRTLETGVPQQPATIQDVDPVARFQQIFDERFGAEVEFIEGQEETRQITNNVFDSLSRMQALIG